MSTVTGTGLRPPTRLSELTTLRLGGPIGSYLSVTTPADLLAAAQRLDLSRTLLVGGGSNLVVADAGYPGIVLHVQAPAGPVQPLQHDVCAGQAHVEFYAGHVWDDVVLWSVQQGYAGLETLSGIPGTVGAVPLQNVGAYGAEVAQVVTHVVVWDTQRNEERILPAEQCNFGYRTSRFKHGDDAGRFIILRVGFLLAVTPERESTPVAYAELAHRLGVQVGERAPLERVRQAVLALRRGKGMVLDPADHDTWSAGSFFTNPILSTAQAGQLPAAAPRWPVDATAIAGEGVSRPDPAVEGEFVKTSAAWLIAHADIPKGYALPEAGAESVSLSNKHTLALTNRGKGTTSELLALAHDVQQQVFARFGVWLIPEPVLVGCALAYHPPLQR